MKLIGFINEHDYQEIIYVLKQRETEDSRVIFQEGCKEEHMVEDQEDPLVILEEGSKEEHIVEDQLDEPHEDDRKDLVEEEKSWKEFKLL